MGITESNFTDSASMFPVSMRLLLTVENIAFNCQLYVPSRLFLLFLIIVFDFYHCRSFLLRLLILTNIYNNESFISTIF